MKAIDIKQLRKSLGLTQQEFAQKLGLSTSAIQKWEAGGTIPQSKYSALRELINSTKTTNVVEAAPVAPAAPKSGAQVGMVPIIHIDSVGGVWSQNSLTNTEQFIEGYAPFTSARPDDVAITQSGSSMEPSIPSGSLLHIRRVEGWQEYFGYGNIYVLWLKDDRRITKEVQKYSPDPEKYILCHSLNPAVEDERLPRTFIREVWKVVNILTNKGW